MGSSSSRPGVPAAIKSTGRAGAVDHISYRSAVCKRAGLAAIAEGSWAPLTDEQERGLRDADLKANAVDRKHGRSSLLADRPGPKCGRRRQSNVAPRGSR